VRTSANAAAVIAALRLEPLAGEGGLYRQTWRSQTASAIFFLMTPENFSALHRLAKDEMWHFYAGDPVEHVQLMRDGAARMVRMGPDVLAGDQPQVLVPAGTWQGARLTTSERTCHGFALLGCTVSPPWEDDCSTLGVRAELIRTHPAHAELIHALTR
jgi:predicted cupin superfamily sugar epimerase